MKRPIYAISVFILSLFIFLNKSHAQYDPQEWPQITLRFSEGGTLKDLFDSGLRPYRFPSLERSLLEAKHARITVVQRSGEALPEFAAEQISIDPLQGGLLSGIEMNRHKTTLEEARAMMLPYLAKGGRNTQELDQFLAAVKADFLEYDNMGLGVRDFRVRWSDPGGPRYVVTFRKASDPKRPLIFLMMIDWSQVRTPLESRSFYKEPVPPPPGYENVSMQAPKKFGPDSQVDILLSQGKPITGDHMPPELPPSPLLAPTASVPTATPAAAAASPAQLIGKSPALVVERKRPLWLWVAGIFAAAVIAAVALKWRK